MLTETLTWVCPTCLVDCDEPYCSVCGLDLVHVPEQTTGPVSIPAEEALTGPEEVDRT